MMRNEATSSSGGTVSSTAHGASEEGRAAGTPPSREHEVVRPVFSWSPQWMLECRVPVPMPSRREVKLRADDDFARFLPPARLDAVRMVLVLSHIDDSATFQNPSVL